jgi:hypothetical protein
MIVARNGSASEGVLWAINHSVYEGRGRDTPIIQKNETMKDGDHEVPTTPLQFRLKAAASAEISKL